jgi:hypothetical protein
LVDAGRRFDGFDLRGGSRIRRLEHVLSANEVSLA